MRRQIQPPQIGREIGAEPSGFGNRLIVRKAKAASSSAQTGEATAMARGI